MKWIVVLIVLMVLPMTNGYALNRQEKEEIFINLVTQTITKQDGAAFRSLFCDGFEPRLPALFSVHAGSRFTGVNFKPPQEGAFKGIAYDFILSICFEPPETKEMCELFPVKEGINDMCILSNKNEEKR